MRSLQVSYGIGSLITALVVTGPLFADDSKGLSPGAKPDPKSASTEENPALARVPRRIYISPVSPNLYPGYISDWEQHIQRARQQYFPDGLQTGSSVSTAMVDVAILPDGAVENVILRRSSGNEATDTAVLRIAYLAAPFAAFSDDIRKATDVIHILRTWRVRIGGELDLRIDTNDADAWLRIPVNPSSPSLEDLQRRGREIARLYASLDEQLPEGRRPRNKFLTGPPAREYKYASYLEDWERKIKKASSENFPDEVRRRKLQGDLLLDIAINPDGTVVDVTIRRSSGQKILDDAALRIVHLAAPFAPFPADFSSAFDVLHITRTWQFLPDGTLGTN